MGEHGERQGGRERGKGKGKDRPGKSLIKGRDSSMQFRHISSLSPIDGVSVLIGLGILIRKCVRFTASAVN